MGSIQNELTASVIQRTDAALSQLHVAVSNIPPPPHTHTSDILLSSQGLSEAVGGAVGVSLQRLITARYDEVFKGIVLPGFEKACQELFRQIDEAFRRGTSECECVEKHAHLTGLVHNANCIIII